jgi:uncharacterized membrane protein
MPDGDDLGTLKRIPLFSKLHHAHLAELYAAMEPRTFAPGQVIIREGEPPDYFYVVQQGHVQFLIRDAGGREVVVDNADPGESFGELAMITQEPRAARAVAVDEVQALRLPQEAFLQYLHAHPSVAIELLTQIGRRLQRLDNLLRQSVSINPNEVMDERITMGQRVADGFASLIGSWRFIIVQSCILAVWMFLNVVAWLEHWDPYPFILLNLALSFQAAYAGPIIMMSQNRQSAKDRLVAEIDHQVNVKAELTTDLILHRLDSIEQHLDRLTGARDAALDPNAAAASDRD